MCVIADENGVESIAGIMGGEHSGCDETTTDVLIEVGAVGAARNIARTGRELGIITDARYRFERGVDPEFMVPGTGTGDEAGNRVLRRRAERRPRSSAMPATSRKIVSFPVSEVKRLTGIDISEDDARTILERLGFAMTEIFGMDIEAGPRGVGTTLSYLSADNMRNVRRKGHLDVAVPSWRPDIDGKADLVEEVMHNGGAQDVQPMEAIIRLRRSALQHGLTATEGARHITGFVELVRHEGRLNEALMPFKVVGVDLRRLVSVMPLGIRMWLKGKVP